MNSQSAMMLHEQMRIKWHNALFTSSDTKNITIDKSVNDKADVTVYGNSIQNGTPTPDAPIAINSVTGNLVSCGKNLFDADTVLPSLTNPSFPTFHWTKQSDGSFFVSNIGTLVGCIWFKNISGKSGSFHFSVLHKNDKSNTSINYLQLIFYYTDGTCSIIRFKSDADYIEYSLDTDGSKTLDYIKQSYANIAGTWIKDITLTLGANNVSYTPYISSSVVLPEIRKDGFYKSSGILNQGAGVKVLNGTEVWSAAGTQLANTFTAYISLTDSINFPTDYIFLCTHFIGLPAGTTTGNYKTNDSEFCCTNMSPGPLVIFRINKPRLSTPDLNGFKAWLASQYSAGTPVKLYYSLATPVTTTLTPAQLATFYPQTNITTDGAVKGDLEATVKIIGI